MRFNIPSVLAIASLTVAMPTPEQQADNPWAGLLDPWGQYGSVPQNTKRAIIDSFDDVDANSTNSHIAGIEITGEELAKLARRGGIEDYANYIPGCSESDDPSYAESHTYKLNEGIVIPKTGDDDACTTGHGGDHCWTQYFLIESAVEYFDWRQTGSAINCPTGNKSTCSQSLTDMKQECTFTQTSMSNGVDVKLLDLSLKLPIGGPGGKDITIGGAVTYNHVKTTTEGTNMCKSQGEISQCQWVRNDDKNQELCHQVWYADRVLHVWGQAQRTCNKCTDGKVQQNSGDGKVCVRGQKDFDFRVPINRVINCNGKCGSLDAGIPTISNEERRPYKEPGNWAGLLGGVPGF